jgi:hypothetical protein
MSNAELSNSEYRMLTFRLLPTRSGAPMLEEIVPAMVR